MSEHRSCVVLTLSRASSRALATQSMSRFANQKETDAEQDWLCGQQQASKDAAPEYQLVGWQQGVW